MSLSIRRADAVRLAPWHRRAVYVATVALVASGLLWLMLHFWMAVPGEFGETTHPLEPWMLRLHGAAAMAGLVLYGSLLPIHVQRAWSVGRNVALGIALSSLLLLLTVSGYLLYYAGGEDTRPVISALHWIVGLAVPALLVWHVVAGRRRPPATDANREVARDPA
jgi:hypothetical protein